MQKRLLHLISIPYIKMILVVYCINANTTALLIRVFGAQILDFNGQICLKFECNGIKKSWTEIRTTPFYLRQYGMLRIVLSTILCKAPKIGISQSLCIPTFQDRILNRSSSLGTTYNRAKNVVASEVSKLKKFCLHCQSDQLLFLKPLRICESQIFFRLPAPKSAIVAVGAGILKKI